ncbi:type III secretion system chaperone [Achromobacter sp. 79A6]|uniref:type III secretion system chaperone n=1 Tax=unclassified Achromobacter TaxID=2626865 RepID=UPI0021F0CCF8
MPAEVFRLRVAELGQLLGQPDLPVNDAQVCSIQVNESCWVHISYDEEHDRVHWTALVGSVVGAGHASLLRHLLRCNMQRALTAGGYFGVSELTDAITYCYHEPLEVLHAQRFGAVFESFSGMATYWTARLAERAARQSAVDESVATASAGDPGALINRA